MIGPVPVLEPGLLLLYKARLSGDPPAISGPEELEGLFLILKPQNSTKPPIHNKIIPKIVKSILFPPIFCRYQLR